MQIQLILRNIEVTGGNLDSSMGISLRGYLLIACLGIASCFSSIVTHVGMRTRLPPVFGVVGVAACLPWIPESEVTLDGDSKATSSKFLIQWKDEKHILAQINSLGFISPQSDHPK